MLAHPVAPKAFPWLTQSDGARLLVESGKLFARCIERQVIHETFKNIVRQTMDCDGLIVSSFDPHSGLIRCAFAWVDGEAADVSKFPPVAFDPEPGRGMQSEIIRTGEPRLFSDVGRRVEEGTGEYYEESEGEMKELPKGSHSNSQSALMAPLKVDDSVVGVAQVMADHYGAYDERHLLFFEGLAVQMALALDNAKLFEDKQVEIAARAKTEEALREAEHRVLELNMGLERLVSERTAELERTVVDLDNFCYSASHDLRTPLRGISGSAMILLADYADDLPEEAKAHLITMRNGVAKMGKLIDGVLSISRLGRSEMRKSKVNLSKIAANLTAELDTKMKFSIAPDLIVRGDLEMLEKALECLFDNAVKFSAESIPAEIEFGATEKDGERVFFLKDNGIGFDQQYSDKLFLPFEKLHRDGVFPGTGIGLAIVGRIVERHDGRVWAVGNLGEGATIYFTLGENRTR
jgi:signal transduction histidine kinase